jgi:hypothetical protein
MYSKGTKIQFTTRTPTQDEMRDCPRITMTSPTPWNPNDVTLNETSSNPTKNIPMCRISHISKVGTTQRHRHYEYLDPTSDKALLHSIDLCLKNLGHQLMSKIPRNISETSTHYDGDLEDVRMSQRKDIHACRLRISPRDSALEQSVPRRP